MAIPATKIVRITSRRVENLHERGICQSQVQIEHLSSYGDNCTNIPAVVAQAHDADDVFDVSLFVEPAKCLSFRYIVEIVDVGELGLYLKIALIFISPVKLSVKNKLFPFVERLGASVVQRRSNRNFRRKSAVGKRVCYTPGPKWSAIIPIQ